MKTFFATFTLLILASPLTQASVLNAGFKCTAELNGQDVFPALIVNGKYRVALSTGSTNYTDLEIVPLSDLKGWPTYPGGVYYKGASDLWVIFESVNSLSILKPLHNMPVGTRYKCVRTI